MAPALATYAPRDPSRTVLYTVIADHLETFLASLDADPEATGLPAYVQREFYAYLQCGILAYGFLRLGCDTVCDHRAKSVGCQLSQRSHRPAPCSPHPWLLTSRIGTPFALLQLLVFLPQEPFVHARTQRRFEDRDRQRAFALLDGPIGQDDNPFPLPGAHVPG